MKHDWNSTQYLKFERERTQPSRDLAHRLRTKNPQRVLDVGCGPGNSTRVLAEVFPDAHIVGIDNSPNMIDAAKASGVVAEFRLFNANEGLGTLGETFDVVFSNACIQWIPDHAKLLADMFSVLRPGGELAVQIPIQSEQIVHRLIREIVGAWQSPLPEERAFHCLTMPEYYDVLAALTDDFYLWKTVYYQTMSSHTDILEWFRGTGLQAYSRALPPEKYAELERELLHRMTDAFPVQPGGAIIFPFPRLFFTAANRPHPKHERCT